MEDQVHTLHLSRFIQFIFLLIVAGVAGATAWSFRSGFLWTGICLIAVAGPLSALFWITLHVNPGRARVALTAEGVFIDAPPYLTVALPYGSVRRSFEADLAADPRLRPGKCAKGMSIGLYRVGTFPLASGGEARIAANGRRVVGLDTEDGLYLVGPDDFQEFADALSQRLG